MVATEILRQHLNLNDWYATDYLPYQLTISFYKNNAVQSGTKAGLYNKMVKN
jgi:hypothetical protein